MIFRKREVTFGLFIVCLLKFISKIEMIVYLFFKKSFVFECEVDFHLDRKEC